MYMCVWEEKGIKSVVWCFKKRTVATTQVKFNSLCANHTSRLNSMALWPVSFQQSPIHSLYPPSKQVTLSPLSKHRILFTHLSWLLLFLLHEITPSAWVFSGLHIFFFGGKWLPLMFLSSKPPGHWLAHRNWSLNIYYKKLLTYFWAHLQMVETKQICNFPNIHNFWVTNWTKPRHFHWFPTRTDFTGRTKQKSTKNTSKLELLKCT